MNQPWIYMCSPSRSPSRLPLHPIPLGLPSAPGPSACLNIHTLSILFLTQSWPFLSQDNGHGVRGPWTGFKYQWHKEAGNLTLPEMCCFLQGKWKEKAIKGNKMVAHPRVSFRDLNYHFGLPWWSSCSYWNLQALELVLHNRRVADARCKVHVQQQRPSVAKNNKK